MQKNDEIIFKILVLLGLGALLVVSAVLEEYAKYLQGYVIAFFAAVLVACIITACVISIHHLFGLILFGFTLGFITQAIGITSDMWCYEHTFIFVALSWALATVTMEGISKIIRFKLKELIDKPMNVLMILLIFAVIPITLPIHDHWKYAMWHPIPYAKYLEECRPIPKEAEKHEPNMQKIGTEKNTCFVCPENSELPAKCKEHNVPFWLYYLSLLGFAVVMHYHISFTELLSLILAALIMGGISEWIGATAKLWHFRTETLPPLFLVVGCWPLEFLVIRGLAIRMNKSRIL